MTDDAPPTPPGFVDPPRPRADVPRLPTPAPRSDPSRPYDGEHDYDELDDNRLEPVRTRRDRATAARFVTRMAGAAAVMGVGVAGIVGAGSSRDEFGRAGVDRFGPPIEADREPFRPPRILEEPPTATGEPEPSLEADGRRGPDDDRSHPSGPAIRRPIPRDRETPVPQPGTEGPSWAASTRTTDAGYVSTDLGCADGTSAEALDAFFAERVGPVIGHDYQHVYPLGDERYLWVFQDTFIDHPGVADTLGKAEFAHNTALLQDGTCFQLLHRGTPEQPTSFEQGTGEERLSRWFWPMGGELSASGETLSVFWVEMYNVDVDLGPLDGLGWYPIGTYLATYDVDTLARLDFRPAPSSGVSPIYGYAVSSDEEHTYLFGNTFDQNLYRQGGYDDGPHSATAMFLARVPLGELAAAPEYWSAAGWSGDAADAEPIVQRYWAENPMQPRYLGGQWVAATKADGYWGTDLVIDVAQEPWGPWTTVQETEATPRDADPLMLTYHAYLMPWLSGGDGDGAPGDLVVSLSQNARLMLAHAWPNPERYRLRFLSSPFVEAPPQPEAPPTTTTSQPRDERDTKPDPAKKDRRRNDEPEPPKPDRGPPDADPDPPPDRDPLPPQDPSLGDDELRTLYGRQASVNVLADDEAVAPARLRHDSVRFQNGATSIDINDNQLTVDRNGLVSLTPASGDGDSFRVGYSVVDSNGMRGTANIDVTVEAPPTAVEDRLEGAQGDPIPLDPSLNDLPSATTGSHIVPASVVFPAEPQPEGAFLSDGGKTLTIPEQGTYAIGSNGRGTFTPEEQFVGGEGPPVTYLVSDSDGVTVSGTIVVTVTPDPPAAVNDTYETWFDTASEPFYVAGNDTPSDPEVVQFTSDRQVQDAIVSDDQGMVTLPGKGVFTMVAGQATFDPEFGFVGPARARYEIIDRYGASASAQITVTVQKKAFGTDDQGASIAGAPAVVPVLANDVPPDGAAPDPASLVFPTDRQPLGALVTRSGRTITVPVEGVYTVRRDGQIRFVPEEGFSGALTTPVWYRVENPNGLVGAAVLTVDVQG